MPLAASRDMFTNLQPRNERERIPMGVNSEKRTSDKKDKSEKKLFLVKNFNLNSRSKSV